jgi:hypothetical protein
MQSITVTKEAPRGAGRRFARRLSIEPETGLRWLPVFAAASAISMVTGLVLARHIVHGGLYSDDWGFAGDYQYVSSARYLSAVAQQLQLAPGRPLLAALHPAPYALFGVDPTPHLALAAGLSALVAFAFYCLLRALGVSFVDSTLIALLALLFPWSDSARLWATGAMNNVAIILFIGGVLLALRAGRGVGRRGHAWHVGALLLYVLSLLTYEAVTVAAFAAGALYLGQTSRRRAFRLWFVDALVVLVVVAYDWAVTAPGRGVTPLRERIVDVPHFARDGAWLLARSLDPTVGSRAACDLVLLAMLGVVVLASRRRQESPEAKRWLTLGALGAAMILAAYVPFVGSSLYPLSPGVDNRGNILAALGFVLLAYAILRLAALVVLPRPPIASAMAAGLAAVALIVWYGDLVRRDANLWDRAAATQADILEKLHRAMPRPRSGTTIYLYGSSSEVAPGIPVFGRDWDFNGAVKFLYDDGSLRAFPVSRDGLRCGELGVPRPLGIRYNHSDVARYGRIVGFDAATQAFMMLDSRAGCHQANRLYSAKAGTG